MCILSFGIYFWWSSKKLSIYKLASTFFTFFLNPHLRTFLLILERGEVKERERERKFYVREEHLTVTSHRLHNWDQTHNLGMCPGWKSNPQSFRSPDNTPTKWAMPASATVLSSVVYNQTKRFTNNTKWKLISMLAVYSFKPWLWSFLLL